MSEPHPQAGMRVTKIDRPRHRDTLPCILDLVLCHMHVAGTYSEKIHIFTYMGMSVQYIGKTRPICQCPIYIANSADLQQDCTVMESLSAADVTFYRNF